MASLYNADLKPLGAGTPTHPYDHATKLFIADTFRLAPKQSFLYYVVINLDTNFTSMGGGFLGTALSLADRYQGLENGLLVKRIDLPKFTLNTKTLNSYNRKNIIQTNIQYDPITVGFHDDAADVITNFWNDYYTYYYRDSDYDSEAYRQPYKYDSRNKVGWGFSPRNGGMGNGSRQLPSMIKNISIFSLHNKRFTQYYLVNPVITGWRHGEHDSSNGSGLMENSMTVAYETVKYYTGYTNPVDVDGFSLLHYDNFDSPISNSVTNIYSDAGLLGALENTKKDLARPQGGDGSGGALSNLLTAYRAYNNLKNVNLKNVVGTTLGQIGGQILNSTLNAGISAAFPSLGSGVTGTGSSQLITGGTTGSFGYSTGYNSGGVTIGGSFASAIVGAGINASTQVTNQISSSINRGITNTVSSIASPGSTKVFDVSATRGTIQVDPKTQQPVTGTITAVLLDDNGNQVSTIQTTGTQNGIYNPNNPLDNLKSVQTVRDESGNYVSVTTYTDGTQITEDSDGNRIGYVPGTPPAATSAATINTNPQDTRALAQQGYPTTGTQYKTDPTTGVTYTVGGTTSAQITNTLAGTTGAVTGLYAGQTLNSALNSTFLGKSVVGRTLSAAISTATGAAVGRAVNNGLQPIVNSVTGQITQAWDSASGQIKNVVGSWSGTGGYDPGKPLDNIVTKAVDTNGSNVYTYKDGTVRTVDAEGVQTVSPGTNNAGTSGWFNGSSGQNKDSAAVSPAPGTILVDSQGQPVTTGTSEYVYEADASLAPQALTDAEWNQLAKDDQAALDYSMENYPAPPGPDVDPVQAASDLGDFYG